MHDWEFATKSYDAINRTKKSRPGAGLEPSILAGSLGGGRHAVAGPGRPPGCHGDLGGATDAERGEHRHGNCRGAARFLRSAVAGILRGSPASTDLGEPGFRGDH